MKKQTIICRDCGEEKPIVEGCFIAISASNDRCKECEDKLKELSSFLSKVATPIANEMINKR